MRILVWVLVKDLKRVVKFLEGGFGEYDGKIDVWYNNPGRFDLIQISITHEQFVMLSDV